jgi:hypothetical protein
VLASSENGMDRKRCKQTTFSEPAEESGTLARSRLSRFRNARYNAEGFGEREIVDDLPSRYLEEIAGGPPTYAG